MNTISHQRAHEWIQVQLDGQLDEARISALNTHFQDCAACRSYAAVSEHLDSELRRAYRERAHLQHSVLSHSLSIRSVIHLTNKQMRLKMKNKQIMNAVTSLAFLALMIVAALGFSWIVSTRGKVILPAAGNETAPTLTPTPFLWTESNPLTSAEQIQSILNGLAQKNINEFLTSAWVHVVRKDQAEPGMTRSAYSESWTHYPRDNRFCAESLSFASDQPGTADFLQIIVGLSDGTIGDLIQLRSGEAQVTRSEPGSDSCSLASEFTAAGQFAFRLNRERAASPQKGVDAKAWYSEQNGRTVFNVSVTFAQNSKANLGVTKETRSFDLETGLQLAEHVRTEWKDGSVFNETLQGYQTDFLPELPANVAAQFELYSAELKSYASRVAIHPSETAMPSSFDYTARAGDTCGGLAVSNNVSIQSIVTQNNLSSRCIISPGQKLKIPYPTATPVPPPTGVPNEATQTAQACEKISYTVQANDTLSSIAANYNVRPDAIKHYNGLSVDTIFLGQSLIIPLCERSTVVPTPTPPSGL